MRRRDLLSTILLALLLVCCACSSDKTDTGPAAPAQSSQTPGPVSPGPGGTVPEGLPGLPGLAGGALADSGGAIEAPGRRSSYDQFEFVDGNAIYSASSVCQFVQDSCLVVPGPHGPGWAIYSVNTGGYQPSRLEVNMRLSENGSAFVALSRYSSGRWDIRGPFTGPASIQVGSGDYLSGAGDSADRRFYFAVLVDDAYAEHSFSEVHFDNAVPAGTRVSGRVLDEQGDPVAGMRMQLQPLGRYVESDAAGNFIFYDVPDGDYDLSPDDAAGDYDFFEPPLRSISISGDQGMQDFTATRLDIRGRLSTNDRPLPLVEMVLNPGGVVTKTDTDGRYEFRKLVSGNYTVAVFSGGIDTTPPSYNLFLGSADLEGNDFTANGLEPAYSINGTVRDGVDPVVGAVLYLQPGGKIAVTDDTGYYAFYTLAPGNYVVSAALSGYKFTPDSQAVTIIDNGQTADFSAEPIQLYHVIRECIETDLSDVVLGFMPGVDVYFADVNTASVVAVRRTDQFGQASVDLPAGEYYSYLQHPLFNGVASFGSESFTLSGDLVISRHYNRNNTVTWKNFVAEYISTECLQCHRPDAQTAVDPPLRTYDEVVAKVNSCNSRIQNDTMPPGNPSHDAYKRWFKAWRDAGTQLE